MGILFKNNLIEMIRKSVNNLKNGLDETKNSQM